MELQELNNLELTIKGNSIETFRALRKIRDERGFMLLQNPSFKTFGQYCKDRLGFTTAWVSQGIQWLKVQELAEANAINAESLTIAAAQPLVANKTDEEIVATLEHLTNNHLPMTINNVKAAPKSQRLQQLDNAKQQLDNAKKQVETLTTTTEKKKPIVLAGDVEEINLPIGATFVLVDQKGKIVKGQDGKTIQIAANKTIVIKPMD